MTIATAAISPAFRSSLIEFVADAIRDRPVDVHHYMWTWAGRKSRSTANGTTAAAAARQEAARTSPHFANADTQHAPTDDSTTQQRSSTRSYEDMQVLERELNTLAAHRLAIYWDISDGCRDQYMIALEDSENDLEYLRSLETEMHQRRDTAQRISMENIALGDEIKAHMAEAKAAADLSTAWEALHSFYLERKQFLQTDIARRKW